jgi:hypothetical protein
VYFVNPSPTFVPAMPPRPSAVPRRPLLLSALALAGLFMPLPRATAAPPAELAPSRVITRGPKHHWFGYYDKLQFDPSDRYVLGMEVDFEHRSPGPDDVVTVGMVDLEDGDRWIELGESRAWNWQQGCMLQWRPGSESEVLWNDREGDRFVCRLLDVKTGRRRTIPHPIYSVSPDGTSAVTCDFRRLQDVRPGYGYAGLADPHADELAPAETGIFHVDLETGEARLIIPVASIIGIGANSSPDPEAKHYFNHLLFNPDGSRFIALHRCRLPDKTWRSRMITARPDGSDIHVVIPNGSVSHFIWRDPTHILAQSRDWLGETRWGNFLFEDVDGGGRVEQIGKDVLDPGGHLLYLPGNEWILNDTYPKTDRRLQTPHLYHVASGRRFDIGHFHLPPEYTGEWRVDTHPRLNRAATVVYIDAPHGDEGRQMHLIDIRGVLAQAGEAGDWGKQSAALAATPWPSGTVRVPKQPTLAAGIVPRVGTPSFPIRTLGWERSFDPWGLRNRINGGYAWQWGEQGYVNGKLSCHTFHSLVPPEEHFAVHPEWYSLLGGTRQWKEGQLCLSNPEVAAAAARTLAGIFRGVPESQRPTRHLASVSVMDHEGDCECEACRTRAQELGGTGGLVLDFVNRVAAQVAPEFP